MVCILSKRVEDVSLQQLLLSRFYSFEPIFLGIFWSDKLHNCVGGICFNISQGNTKKKLSGTFHGNGCQGGKNASPITRSLQIRTTTEKSWLDLISRPTKQEKIATSKNLYFEQKGPKVKKHLHVNFLATYHKTFYIS